MSFPQTLLQKGNKLDWQTPLSLYRQLDNEFHFVLDAATSEANHLKAPKFYTEKDNGIFQPWYDPTYCNPPYGRNNIMVWLEKARLEQTNGVTSVFLLPSRTGTIWFHKYIYNKPTVETRFLKGRLIFEENEERQTPERNTAPFDSMIVIFHKHD